VVTRLFLCRDSVGCITATRLPPNQSAPVKLDSLTRLPSGSSGSRLDLGSPLVSGRSDRSKTMLSKALEFKKDASCIITGWHLVLMSHTHGFHDYFPPHIPI
jgi:hypothetical protein